MISGPISDWQAGAGPVRTEDRKGLPLRSVLLALLSGLLLTSAFPPGRFHWMAWFSLVPLFWGLRDLRPRAAFKLGLIAGLAHYTSLIYWIVLVLSHYGNLGLWIAIWPFLLLCLYLSLYTAFFSWFAALDSRFSFHAVFAAAAWVALEFARARLLTGFPWCLLGYSQYEQISLLQLSNLTGVYGLSFLIVLCNAVVFRILASRGRSAPRSLRYEIGLSAFLLASTFLYGESRLRAKGLQTEEAGIPVAIVQANIDQSVKWDPAYQKATMETYASQTLRVKPFKPRLIVWPETATPFFYQENREYGPRVQGLVAETEAVLIFGSPAYQDSGGKISYFNRAYVLSPRRPPLWYDKVHLVPFGEYVPLKRWLPFVHRLVPAAGDFQSGKDVHPLPADGLSAGILICFEAIFPEITRQHVLKGAKALVNLTNDAWFGSTSAPHHHLAMAAFRAAENERPLIRAANTGISALIDERGRIIARGPLFEAYTLRGEIASINGSPTLYAAFGDWLPLALIALCLGRGLFFLSHKRRIPTNASASCGGHRET